MDRELNHINVIPLVDVMLVMLQAVAVPLLERFGSIVVRTRACPMAQAR